MVNFMLLFVHGCMLFNSWTCVHVDILQEWLDMSVQLTGVPHSTVVLPMLRDVLFQPPQALRNRVLTHHLTRCSLVLQMWTGTLTLI